MKNIYAVVFVLFLFLSFGCGKDQPSDQPSGNQPQENQSPEKEQAGKPSLQIFLQDSPDDYSKVWVDIEKVSVKTDQSGNGTGEWQELPLSRTGAYNLLDFQEGKDTILAAAEELEGKLQMIRIQFGPDNSIELKDNTVRDLLIPSGQTKQVDLEIENMFLKKEETLDLTLDFDLVNSIQEPPRPDSGDYYLKPYIKVFQKGFDSGLEGWWASPVPTDLSVFMVSADNKDTLRGAPDFSENHFRFLGVPDGTYNLFMDVYPDNNEAGYYRDSVKDILLLPGQVTKLDTIRLNQK